MFIVSLKFMAIGKYNLKNLQWLEFEELCCDVLGEFLKVPVKRGKVGRDGGKDGQVFSDDGEIVLQVKHYAESGSRSLIGRLKRNEVPKAEWISAKRYIIMTSCELSPNDRDEVFEAYHGLIKSKNDIFSGADICALLSQDRYQWVVRKHYNLWLSGIEQLEIFCGDGINSKFAAVLDEIRDALQKTVKTQDYEHAYARLLNDKVIIITGQAGTGKTILAKQLIAEFVFNQNYKFFCTEYEIKGFEAQIERHQSEKILFFIDDFLGANIMDALRENRDSQIVTFIKRIRRSQNLKLVLTSRSYIIREAIERAVKFADAKISSFEYRLDEKNLERIDKAKILYSHFHYGDVTQEYKKSIIEGENYFKIVDHNNFNPRIISYCFDADRIGSVMQLSGKNGISKVLWLLDNPSLIWRDCFESFDNLKKYIVFMIYLAGAARFTLKEEYLIEAFKRMIASAAFSDYKSCAFNDVIKSLCRSVITRSVIVDAEGQSTSFSLFNPSVGDYILTTYFVNEEMFVDVVLFLELGEVFIQINRDSLWQRNSKPQYAIFCQKIVHKTIDKVIANPMNYAPNFVLKVFNEIASHCKEENKSRILMADGIVRNNLLSRKDASCEEVIKFLYSLWLSSDALYREVRVDSEFLDKTIETTKNCETLLLLGDLYASIDAKPPEVFYKSFKSCIGEWFDKIAERRDEGTYKDESAVLEDVYDYAIRALIDHNIDPDVMDLDSLTEEHNFSSFVAGDDDGSSWQDIKDKFQLRKNEEDLIIRKIFMQEEM